AHDLRLHEARAIGLLIVAGWDEEGQIERRHEDGRVLGLLLRLPHADLGQLALVIPAIADLELWMPRLVDPLLEELRQAAAAGLLVGALEVGGDHLALTVAPRVELHAAPERRIALDLP